MFVQLGHPLAPKIWTDRLDYHPNSTVIIRGSDFLPDTLVAVNVTWPDGSLHTLNSIKTGDAGNFTVTHQIDVARGTYSVAATDGTYTAKTTFTDGSVGPDPNTSSHKIKGVYYSYDSYVSITTNNPNDVVYACIYVPGVTYVSGSMGGSLSGWASRGSYVTGSGIIQCYWAKEDCLLSLEIQRIGDWAGYENGI